MKRIARSLVLVFFTSVVVGAAAQQQELERLEAVWNEAHLHGDADALDRLWHEDLLVIAPRMPVMTKADALAFARSGRMKFQRYETTELKVRAYATTALVTGRLRRSRTVNGRQTDDDWRFTKVYLRDQHGWRVVSFHACEAGPL